MSDKVQAKVDQVKTSLFHFSLVKFLVLEELKKLNNDWDSFLSPTRIYLDPKGDTPLSDEKTSPLIPEDSKRREKRSAEEGHEKVKEVEGASPSQQAKKKGIKLYFVDEVTETPKLSSPITRSIAKILPALHTQSVKHTTQGIGKDQFQSGEKDEIIGEM
jgi:hypothetical protein